MNTLILAFSIICFLNSMFWLVSNVTGPFFFKVMARLVGIAGTALPLIYWLKLAGTI